MKSKYHVVEFATLVITVLVLSLGGPVLADEPDPGEPPTPGGPVSGGPAFQPVEDDLRYALVRSRLFDIDYQVNPEAQPLSRVELWYKTGRDGPWHRYGLDDDRQSPVVFNAPSEGLYGFYLILTNAAGASGGPPTPDAQPHHWAFIDYTPPIVQVHPPQPTMSLGIKVVRLRWTALDDNLTSRPVALSYRVLPEKTWTPIQRQRLPNSGQLDWRVGDDVTGMVVVRAIIRDRAGNVSEGLSEPFDLTALHHQPASDADSEGSDSGDTAATAVATTAVKPTTEAAERARRLRTLARSHRLKGEVPLAIARLRDAIDLTPNDAEAIAELGALLYASNDHRRALEAYGIAIQHDPSARSALIGIAEVYAGLRRYDDAADSLAKVARLNPRDVEAWMHLGDIAIRRGDEILARQNYEKAATLDPTAAAIVAAAKRRLANMEELSRTYAGPGDADR